MLPQKAFTFKISSVTDIFFTTLSISSGLRYTGMYTAVGSSRYDCISTVFGIQTILLGLIAIPIANGVNKQSIMHTMSLATLKHHIHFNIQIKQGFSYCLLLSSCTPVFFEYHFAMFFKGFLFFFQGFIWQKI